MYLDYRVYLVNFRVRLATLILKLVFICVYTIFDESIRRRHVEKGTHEDDLLKLAINCTPQSTIDRGEPSAPKIADLGKRLVLSGISHKYT